MLPDLMVSRGSTSVDPVAGPLRTGQWAASSSDKVNLAVLAARMRTNKAQEQEQEPRALRLRLKCGRLTLVKKRSMPVRRLKSLTPLTSRCCDVVAVRRHAIRDPRFAIDIDMRRNETKRYPHHLQNQCISQEALVESTCLQHFLPHLIRPAPSLCVSPSTSTSRSHPISSDPSHPISIHPSYLLRDLISVPACKSCLSSQPPPRPDQKRSIEKTLAGRKPEPRADTWHSRRRSFVPSNFPFFNCMHLGTKPKRDSEGV